VLHQESVCEWVDSARCVITFYDHTQVTGRGTCVYTETRRAEHCAATRNSLQGRTLRLRSRFFFSARDLIWLATPLIMLYATAIIGWVAHIFNLIPQPSLWFCHPLLPRKKIDRYIQRERGFLYCFRAARSKGGILMSCRDFCPTASRAFVNLMEQWVTHSCVRFAN
jgi:hypothetical protein